MVSSFHLGFSGLFLARPATGSGQYARQLLRELARLFPGPITVFCPDRASAQAGEELLRERDDSRCSVVVVTPPLAGNLGKLWFEQVGLPWAARARRVELLHVPYFGPPLWAPCPVVVTVHDVIPLALPEHRGPLTVRAYTALAAASTKRARLIVTDSLFSKQEITRLLGVPLERTRAIYLACAERFLAPVSSEEQERVRRRYELSPPFILYLGSFAPRKNVPALLRAWATASTEGWTLVLAGEMTGTERMQLTRLAEELGIAGGVRFLGYVAEEEKPALYSLAELFVFPSRYEGFGLPPLEAMACGTPVLCARATSLHEAVGDAAVLFDPDDPQELAQQLRALLEDTGRREALRERGRQWARRFSWRQTALETLAAYREALRGEVEW